MPRVNYQRLGEDFALRFEQTYLQYRHAGKKELETVFVRGVTPTRDTYPNIALQGFESGVMQVVYNTEGEFFYDFPPAGYFNYSGRGYIFSRQPVRQNKRSMAQANTNRMNFYSLHMQASSLDLSLPVANAIFKRKYETVEEAVKRLNKRTVPCVAIGKDFGLGLNIVESPNHLLFHYFTPIGEVSPEGTLVRTFDSAFDRYIHETTLK